MELRLVQKDVSPAPTPQMELTCVRESWMTLKYVINVAAVHHVGNQTVTTAVQASLKRSEAPIFPRIL